MTGNVLHDQKREEASLRPGETLQFLVPVGHPGLIRVYGNIEPYQFYDPESHEWHFVPASKTLTLLDANQTIVGSAFGSVPAETVVLTREIGTDAEVGSWTVKLTNSSPFTSKASLSVSYPTSIHLQTVSLPVVTVNQVLDDFVIDDERVTISLFLTRGIDKSLIHFPGDQVAHTSRSVQQDLSKDETFTEDLEITDNGSIVLTALAKPFEFYDPESNTTHMVYSPARIELFSPNSNEPVAVRVPIQHPSQGTRLTHIINDASPRGTWTAVVTNIGPIQATFRSVINIPGGELISTRETTRFTIPDYKKGRLPFNVLFYPREIASQNVEILIREPTETEAETPSYRKAVLTLSISFEERGWEIGGTADINLSEFRIDIRVGLIVSGGRLLLLAPDVQVSLNASINNFPDWLVGWFFDYQRALRSTLEDEVTKILREEELLTKISDDLQETVSTVLPDGAVLTDVEILNEALDIEFYMPPTDPPPVVIGPSTGASTATMDHAAILKKATEILRNPKDSY